MMVERVCFGKLGDEVGFGLATANSNPVWAMTACCG